MTPALKNTIVRTITGGILIAVLISSILFHLFSFAAVILIIGILSFNEYLNIVKSKKIKPQFFLGTLLSIIIIVGFITCISGYISVKVFLIVIPIIFIMFFKELFGNNKKPLANISYTLLGVVYIILPLCALAYMPFFRSTEYNGTLVIAFFVIVWAYDTFAYLTGITIGRHRLYERISPKKSWEGAIGGLIFAVAGTIFIAKYYPILSLTQWIVFSIIVIIFATFGDLTESMIKRNYQIKDSGSILPGHGGMLDRFDSIFFAAPAVLCYLVIIQ